MALEVCEIFYSIQGESTFCGLPCVFIRLAGCNLACSWCDTAYAAHEKTVMSTDEVIGKIRAFACALVEVTGGEPLLQADTPRLIQELIDAGHQILLETNGSRDISGIHPDCIKIVDIKCPSSGEGSSFLDDNITHLSANDEVKFVIGAQQDYLFAKTFIQEKLCHISPLKIHLSPVFGRITPEAIAAWMLQDRLPARLSLQLHKIIWDPDKRGV